MPSINSTAPAQTVLAVTASDTADLVPPAQNVKCRGLLVGSAGNAKLTDISGNVVASVPLQQGYNPIAVQRVWSTGLTASNIFALY